MQRYSSGTLEWVGETGFRVVGILGKIYFRFSASHNNNIICSPSQMYYHVYGGVRLDHWRSSQYTQREYITRTRMIHRSGNMLYHHTPLPYPPFLVRPNPLGTRHSNTCRSSNHRLLEPQRSLIRRKSSNISASILVIGIRSCSKVTKGQSSE
jgi:hypothetical protein